MVMCSEVRGMERKDLSSLEGDREGDSPELLYKESVVKTSNLKK